MTSNKCKFVAKLLLQVPLAIAALLTNVQQATAQIALRITDPVKLELATQANEQFSAVVVAMNAELDKQQATNEELLRERLLALDELVHTLWNADLAIVMTSKKPLLETWYDKQFLRRAVDLGICKQSAAWNDFTREECSKAITSSSESVTTEAIDTEALENAIASIRGLDYSGAVTCEPVDGGMASGIDEEVLTKLLESAPRGDVTSIRAAIENAFKLYNKSCQRWTEGLDRLSPHGGEIRATQVELAEAKQQLANAKSQGQSVAKLLSEARETLKASLPQSGKKPSELIAKEIERVNELLGSARSLAALAKQETLFQTQLGELASLLEAPTNTADENEPGSLTETARDRARLAIAALPGLADDLVALEQVLNAKPTTALVMVQQALEARLVKVRGELRFETERIALLEARAAVLVREVRDLNAANGALLGTAGEASKRHLLSHSFLELDLHGSAAGSAGLPFKQARQGLKAAVARQIHAANRSARSHYAKNYSEIGLAYARTVTRSRAAIAEWVAMVGPLIAQQERYYKLGQDPSALVSFAVEVAKVIGIFSID